MFLKSNYILLDVFWSNMIQFDPTGLTASYDEIKQKVITQANDYHRVKAYTL